MTDPVANTTPAANTPAPESPYSTHPKSPVTVSFDEWLAATGDLFAALTKSVKKALSYNDEELARKEAVEYIMHDKKVTAKEALELYEQYLYFRKTNAEPGQIVQSTLDPYGK